MFIISALIFCVQGSYVINSKLGIRSDNVKSLTYMFLTGCPLDADVINLLNRAVPGDNLPLQLIFRLFL
jgi:hypothetical protein